jgi:hypothetical protein
VCVLCQWYTNECVCQWYIMCVSGTLVVHNCVWSLVCSMQASGRRLPSGKVPVTCLIIAAIKIHASDASVTLKDATGLFSALFNFTIPLT